MRLEGKQNTQISSSVRKVNQHYRNNAYKIMQLITMIMLQEIVWIQGHHFYGLTNSPYYNHIEKLWGIF